MKTVENEAVKNTHNRTLYIALTAMFTALVFAVTFFANIPASFILGAGGNINLGDAVIFIAAVVLGPVGGAVAGALGAAAADISGAYIIYAPFTLVIKGAAGFMCGLLSRYAFKGIKNKRLKRAVSIAAAAAIIVAGYFFAEAAIVALAGGSDFSVTMLAASRTVVPNLLQVGLSSAIALIALPKLADSLFFADTSADSPDSTRGS
jgi:uncharacterized membrane protein